MANLQLSPISQLLHTLGITREDLNRRSDQMRLFLTADGAKLSRDSERDNGSRSRSNSDIRSRSRATTSSVSLTRSVSGASTNSLHEGSPPVTPVKSEPQESGLPPRQYDSMEMVIERQRRSRRDRKSKKKERDLSSKAPIPHPPSPSPSNASQSAPNLDSFMKSRDDRRVMSVGADETAETTPSKVDFPPVTPRKSKYYRDHTNIASGSQPRKEASCKSATPTPTRAQSHSHGQPIPQYYAYPHYIGYPQYIPVPYVLPTAQSVTPKRPQPLTKNQASSPLPPSSPPLASSPLSSPNRRVVNLVSSPGPMGPMPQEDEYESLPYKLPPGPYSPNKPELSYAALVGQAILSSPEHRLTLQEIYDWITIVYPHYKRGETTWMNSIRHVLSTTVCFRKVPRERSLGRTLWAIWDEDLECFKGGGFRKQFCKDFVNGSDSKDKQPSSKGKSKGRKRSDEDEGDSRKSKRPKKEVAAKPQDTRNSPTFNTAQLSSHPLFPPTRPTPHHQPYYESCVPQFQQLPAEIIFPPLPAAAAFNRVVGNPSLASSASSTNSKSITTTSKGDRSTSSPQSDPSTVSVPELTPNRGSSSPPSSFPSTSDMDVDISRGDPCNKSEISTGSTSDTAAPIEKSTLDDIIFNDTLLGPVQYWGEPPKSAGTLQPGIELLNFDESSSEEDLVVKDKENVVSKSSTNPKIFALPPPPASPLNNRNKSLPNDTKKQDSRAPSTPPPIPEMPSTPPRSANKLQLSSVRTPISHKGLHMSPTASLLHYKSNLDPPPTLKFDVSSSVLGLSRQGIEDDDVDPMRTPRKRTSSSGGGLPPVTPKKLIFSTGLNESPFRTPSRGLGISPFRTPGSRSIFDPHDPRTMLDEELNRMGNGESPGGLFGKGTGSLLYDSPDFGSPGKYARWW